MADEWVLNEGERLDDLVRDDMKLIQRPDHFCFSVDSVLLAHYVEPVIQILYVNTQKHTESTEKQK